MTVALPRLAVLVVTYGNPEDVDRCLRSLALSALSDFEIFVCENGGETAFSQLVDMVLGPSGVLEKSDERAVEGLDQPGGRIVDVVTCRFCDRPNIVRIGRAVDNLGYGGGVNAWLERLLDHSGWDAVLVLNPDTEVDEACLYELLKTADQGHDMVGPTLVFDESPERIVNCGLRWSPTTGRVTAVGRNLPADRAPPAELLSSIDAVSGACVLATRPFIEEVGLMAEDYFLYMEDLDWGRRRGHRRIGFAEKAIVRHVGGTTIGSSIDPRQHSPLSVYLSARNSILYARRWAGRRWLLHLGTGLLYAMRYALIGAPTAARLTLSGLLDGTKGRTGKPDTSLWSRKPS
ncbi:Glycosyltransferase family 2 protein [Hyphomicrobiales bacterium]|nr:Glycosyltransferase family 2 protein [Hyphomicrobiales bacterium]CAH1699173.1 Glycosyltransferase family 2 protein [Hyphomicrobiales bacterium]CAI0342959.1 Glycosyltransferase family 2 protein [Hyphomicrobiales bacterium]